MADVTLTYKGNTIAEMSDTGTKTLKTAGKYCEGDIGVSYVKPSSGGTSDDLAKKMITREGIITELPSDITKIGDSAFRRCTNLALTSLPNGITSIGMFAFSECGKALTLSSLPDSVTSIKQQAFEHTNITITTLPSGITEIPYEAFSYCVMLTSMTFPQNIDAIRSFAFEHCSRLTTITFKGTPSSIASNAFLSCPITTINVPWAEGAVADAPWGATNATINYNYTE